MGALPPVFIEFLGKATGFHATAKGVRAELAAVEKQGAGNMARLGAVSKAALLGVGVAAAVAAVKTVHMAADFQTQMTRVRTGAGEAAKNMGLVGDGILRMAGQVGESTKDLTSGLYTVESAGFHGADALKVLETSAMGAKVGAADLATVTDAVTTALNAYHLSAKDSIPVMNALVATEASGKTNMEALAGSMASILPVSAAAHVGLNEVLGAMATMTAQGTSADSAATYLRQTIGQLSNPSAKAAATMKALGLSAVDVGKELGTKGLAATLTTLTDAIKRKMGPSGTVLIDTLQKAAKHSRDFQGALNRASGSQKTYIGALATMVGGTRSMMGALQLTGSHMAVFRADVQSISKHVRDGGHSVEGWADVQKTFNQRMAEAKGSMQAIGIQIGTVLLPYATRMIGVFAHGITWLTKHKTAVEVLGAAIGGILVIGLAAATVAVWNFTAALLADPLTWVVIGIMALIAAIVLLVKHWKTVWHAIETAAVAVGHALVAAWNWVAGEASNLWNNDIVKPIVEAWHWLGAQASNIWNNYIVHPILTAWHAVESFFVSAWHAVADPIVAGWHWISKATSAVWNAILGFFRKWWPLLLVIFATPIAFIMGIWNHFHEQITTVATTVWHAIAAFFSTVWNGISTAAVTVWNVVSTFFVTVWNGIAAAASSIWHLIYEAIAIPVKMVGAFLVSAWHAIESAAVATWHGISAAAVAVWHAIYSAIISPIENAWHTVTSTMGKLASTMWNKMHDVWTTVTGFVDRFMQAGHDIVWGIIHGVENAGGALIGKLKDLAGSALKAAKDFLGIKSPSRVFRDEVGKWIPHGIAEGVRSNASAAHSAIADTANGMVQAFSTALGIASPSKVFRQLGIWIHEGLIAGLTGSQSRVKSAIKRTETLLMEAQNRLADLMTQTLKGTGRHHRVDTGMVAWIRQHERAVSGLERYVSREGAQLDRLAAKRATVAKHLADAQKNLSNLQKAWTKERDDIASSIMQGASIVTSPDDSGNLSVNDVVANMRTQVQAAMQFAANLDALKKRGLRSDLIQQIASAGVDQGGATAAALQSANAAQIKQLNGMQSSLSKAANSTGAVVADSMYANGINAAKGLVKGLRSQEKAIDAQMLRIAKSMERAIKAALGIRSPSRLFHDIGTFVSMGLANGIDESSNLAASASGRLAETVTRSANPRLHMTNRGAGIVHETHVHIEVHGSIRSDKDLRDIMRQEMLRLGSRNSATWQPFKR